MSGRANVGVCAVRASRLDADGTPVDASDTGAWVFGDFVSGEVATEWDDGAEVLTRDACGRLCVYVRRDDQPKRVTLNNLQICASDPRQMELLLSGAAVLLGDAEAPTGFALIAGGCAGVVRNGVALELWVPQYLCNVPDPDVPWRRIVIPRARLRYNGGTRDQGHYLYSFSGYGEPNANFGNGPFNDLDDLLAVPQAIYAEFEDPAGPPTIPDPADYTATPAEAS